MTMTMVRVAITVVVTEVGVEAMACLGQGMETRVVVMGEVEVEATEAVMEDMEVVEITVTLGIMEGSSPIMGP